MTEHRRNLLSSAIGNIDTSYLEEALDFEVRPTRAKRVHRFPKLSAACVALLLLLGVSATAFAISRIPLSWRDIFSLSHLRKIHCRKPPPGSLPMHFRFPLQLPDR